MHYGAFEDYSVQYDFECIRCIICFGKMGYELVNRIVIILQ